MRGIVFPAKWDRNGQVLQVVLDTMEHGQYSIEKAGPGKSLWGLLSCEVDVYGTVAKDKNGNILLKVSSYRLLEDAESERAA